MISLYMPQCKRLKNPLLRWMDHYFKHMIQMLLTICVASSIQAAELNFQKVLEQERAWAGLSSKKVKNNEIEWTYSEGGDPRKPTLLLLHGLSGTRDNWNRVARYLTPNYHVIIPDLPAHGALLSQINLIYQFQI